MLYKIRQITTSIRPNQVASTTAAVFFKTTSSGGQKSFRRRQQADAETSTNTAPTRDREIWWSGLPEEVRVVDFGQSDADAAAIPPRVRQHKPLLILSNFIILICSEIVVQQVVRRAARLAFCSTTCRGFLLRIFLWICSTTNQS